MSEELRRGHRVVLKGLVGAGFMYSSIAMNKVCVVASLFDYLCVVTVNWARGLGLPMSYQLPPMIRVSAVQSNGSERESKIERARVKY